MTDTLFTNALLLDPEAGTQAERHVLVKGGRIAEVSDTAITAAGDARVVDLKGRTLMPGLIDGHVHVIAGTADFAAMRHWSPFYVSARASDILEAMIGRGFTTVRDAGGADFGVADAVEEGFFNGPRIRFAGHALSQTGGHGDMRGRGENNLDQCLCCASLGVVCDGVAEVRKACRTEIRKGAHQIKIMVSGGVASPTDRISSTQFSIEEIRAAVEEAEAAEIYVMAHAYTARAINRALENGVRSIEHGNLLDESSCDLFVRHGAYLVPTLSTYHALAAEGVAAGLPADLHAKVFDVLDAGTRALELAHRKGVKIVYGTDLLGQMHKHQLREFAIRGEIQPAIDVIRGATTIAAELLQMTGEIGRIVPGARADMLVVDGDPLRDLGVMQDPDRFLKAVVKDGKFYKDAL